MSDRDEADRLVDWLNDPFNGGDLVTMATLRGAIRAYGDSRARQAAEEMRAAAADKMRHCVTEVLVMWDRPGGPPGNGYRVTTNADRADAILALPLPPDLGGRK